MLQIIACRKAAHEVVVYHSKNPTITQRYKKFEGLGPTIKTGADIVKNIVLANLRYNICLNAHVF